MNFKPTLEKRQVYRGDTPMPFNVNFTDLDTGNPIDITGWTVWFTVRQSPASTKTTNDTDAPISKEYPGSNIGTVSVVLTSEDTDITPNTYYYDIQYKKANQAIKTIGVGEFIVLAEVTRSK